MLIVLAVAPAAAAIAFVILAMVVPLNIVLLDMSF
jgi:hypothetical protein